MNRAVAPNTSHGTIAENRSGDVCMSNKVPPSPPRRLGSAKAPAHGSAPLRSSRYPTMLLNDAGQSATVLVALATIGVIPSPTRAGNVRRVPPPATEFMTPLIVAATTTNMRINVADNWTNADSYERACGAMDLRQIKTAPEEFGMMTYDPAFMNTASCRSAITFIDGDKGILRYRGYPIEQLAESATFLEVAWLLRNGELPAQKEYDRWVHDITFHTYVHENIKTFLQGFRYDAHPMSMLCSAVAALSSFYPNAKNIQDPAERQISIVRLLAKVPTIAAFCFRHVKGLPFIYPDNELGYVENFLSMVARMSESKYEGNPVFVKALEVLFILHADHEQNCSTSAVRAVGSSQVDPFSAIAAGIAALYGPLHGGANEQVLHMITQIGHKKNIPAFIEGVKSGKGQKLMGFGHRVYKSYDPRARD